MASKESFDDPNRAAREHIERTRERLRSGRETLARLRAEIDDTNRHLETMASWLEENDRAGDDDEERRSSA